jgi:flagellar hook-associated protein 1 FlgK
MSALFESANALGAFNQVLQVTQNNVANMSTPGFAAQSQQLDAMAFNPPGLWGGVTAGAIESSRNDFAEQAVWKQTTGLGQQQQLVTSLTSLQNNFDISGNTGIPYSLNNFFQSVSAWAQTPTDEAARQAVLSNASAVAQTFQSASVALQNQAQNTDAQIQSTVAQVNSLVGQLQQYNHQILATGDQNDSGIDTGIHSTLEQLSQSVGFTATKQADGTYTVLLNGTTPLLVGDHQYSLSARPVSAPSPPATYANAPPTTELVASDGANITTQTTQGSLGALLTMRNTVLPQFMGDGDQAGELNTLAQQFADRVNTLLTSGNISDGPPAVPGVPLFTYAATNSTDGSNTGTNVAGTLAVNPNITADQLAAISPGPPEVSNGTALALAQLSSPTDPADQINGLSYTQFYGTVAATVGAQLQQAQNGVTVQQSLVAQAQSQRQQISGVDVNQEAMIAVEFQRAYEANSKMITILDQLTQDTINMMST